VDPARESFLANPGFPEEQEGGIGLDNTSNDVE
jgi:hypothetical protein